MKSCISRVRPLVMFASSILVANTFSKQHKTPLTSCENASGESDFFRFNRFFSYRNAISNDNNYSQDNFNIEKKSYIELYEKWVGIAELHQIINSSHKQDKLLMCRAISGMCIQEIKLSLDKQFNNAEIPFYSYNHQVIELQKLKNNIEISLEGSLDCVAILSKQDKKLLTQSVSNSTHSMTGQFRFAHTLVETILHFFNIKNAHINSVEDQLILVDKFFSKDNKELIDFLMTQQDCLSSIYSVFDFLSHIDKAHYINYSPRVSGTSGGGSKALIGFSNQVKQLEETLFRNFDDSTLLSTFKSKSPESLYRLLHNYLGLKKDLGKVWSYHQLMALANIGNTKGTHSKTVLDGLAKLRDEYAFKGMNGDDRIQRLLGQARQYYMKDQPEIGTELIQAYSKEVPVLYFGSQSYGTDTASSNKIPEFYSKRTQIENKIKLLVSDNNTSNLKVSFGPGASYWLENLCRNKNNLHVVLAKDEFLAAKVAVHSHQTTLLELNPGNKSFQTEFDKIPSGVDLIVVSLVNSVDQSILKKEEIKHLFSLLSTYESQPIIYLDGAQAVGNVDLTYLSEMINSYDLAVCITGSTVKHLSSGYGGFMLSNEAFQNKCNQLGGWTTHVMGLRGNIPIEMTQQLFADGPTPNADSYLNFLETFTGINKSHIKSLHNVFFENLANNMFFSKENVIDFSRRNYNDDAWSNTLVYELPSDKFANELLLFLNKHDIKGIDIKFINDIPRLRIGFSQFNSKQSVIILSDLLNTFVDSKID